MESAKRSSRVFRFMFKKLVSFAMTNTLAEPLTALAISVSNCGIVHETPGVNVLMLDSPIHFLSIASVVQSPGLFSPYASKKSKPRMNSTGSALKLGQMGNSHSRQEIEAVAGGAEAR